MGHIISSKYGKKGLDIAAQAYYNIYKKKPDKAEILNYLKKTVSLYSVDETEKGRHKVFKEITPELLSQNSHGESNEFSKEFVRLRKGGV